MASRFLRRLAMPADTWERHRIVASLVGCPANLLDVGGVSGQLELFMPDVEVTTLNVEGEAADRQFEGARIPYEDGEFDAAVSIDVIEHIPSNDRLLHLTELARVARERIVLSCPLGTHEHVEAERQLARWYRDLTGVSHRFLEEHLQRGLPTDPELRRLATAAGLDANLVFHGDFRRTNEVFRRAAVAKSLPRPRTILSYALARFDPRRSRHLEARPTPWTNRVFLTAALTDCGAAPATSDS